MSRYALLVERARIRIGRVEIEAPFAVGIARGQPIVVTIAVTRTLPLQIVDYLLDRIEAVHHQMVAEYMPTRVFAALHTDINDHERLVHQPSLYRPTRKRRSVVEVKVHARKHLLQRRGAYRSSGVRQQPFAIPPDRS